MVWQLHCYDTKLYIHSKNKNEKTIVAVSTDQYICCKHNSNNHYSYISCQQPAVLKQFVIDIIYNLDTWAQCNIQCDFFVIINNPLLFKKYNHGFTFVLNDLNSQSKTLCLCMQVPWTDTFQNVASITILGLIKINQLKHNQLVHKQGTVFDPAITLKSALGTTNSHDTITINTLRAVGDSIEPW